MTNVPFVYGPPQPDTARNARAANPLKCVLSSPFSFVASVAPFLRSGASVYSDTSSVYFDASNCFRRMFRYSTFIGGPTWTCTPIDPSAGRFGASSSTTTAIS